MLVAAACGLGRAGQAQQDLQLLHPVCVTCNLERFLLMWLHVWPAFPALFPAPAVLRECLQWEFSELVGPPGPPGTYGSDQDSDLDAADSTGDPDDPGATAAEGNGGPAAASWPGSAAKAPVRGQRGLNFEALLDDLVVLSFLVSQQQCLHELFSCTGL
jgi:hypothetical protein